MLQSCKFLGKSPSLLSSSPCAFPYTCLCCHLCASSFPSPYLGAFYQRNPCDHYSVRNSQLNLTSFSFHYLKQSSMSSEAQTHTIPVSIF